MTIYIDELDKFAVQMACGDVLHVLQESAHRFGVTVDTLLESPPSLKKVLDLFFSNSVLASLCEAASEGIRTGGILSHKSNVSIQDLISYIQVLLMCSIYDIHPSELLGSSNPSSWYISTEIRKRISLLTFKTIRSGLKKSLGLSPRDSRSAVGPPSLSWRNCCADVPAVATTVEQTVSAANAALTFCPQSSILGIDNDQLRYAPDITERSYFGLVMHPKAWDCTLLH